MSPLCKRLPREFRHNPGKWLGIILLLVLSISLVAGFLMASSSMKRILSTVDDDYHIEDGRFTANFPVSSSILDEIEDLGVTIYPNFSYDTSLKIESSDTDMTARVYTNREQIDLPAYFEGTAPQADNEIALDRVFCKNNGIEVGDTVHIDGRAFTVSGIMSLSDYQAMFEKNTDFVFNAQTFSVAQVSPQGFASLKSPNCAYTYSFIINDRSLTDAQRTDFEQDMLDVLEDNSVALSEFLDRDANNGIGYAEDDIDGDSVMWMTLMYLLIAILAFVFVVLTSSTIDEESAIIGTLLASGYRKREILLHYLALPLFSGVAGALIGNALGYAFLIQKISDLYYNSYSLPPYHTIWDWSVFAQSTLLPVAILVIVTLVGLARKLRCTPLQFLRRETSKRSRKGGNKLPEKLSFVRRFRLRVFGRNISHFATLFLGIMFASLLLLFGLCMLPTVNSYASSLATSLVSEHTYTLKTPVELEGTTEQRTQYAAALKLADAVDLSEIDEDEVKDKLTDVLENRIEERIKESMLTQSTHIDLTSCGLGMVDLTTFNTDSINDDNLDFDAIDFSDISLSDLGLSGVDLGGLSENEFFSLLKDASEIDEDANVVNSIENSATAIAQAEKFVVSALEYNRGNDAGWESVNLYGIQPNSRYYTDLQLDNNTVTAGRGFMMKFDLSVGDTVDFYDKYENKTYTFTIGSTGGNSGTMDIYAHFDTVNTLMGNDADYFSGYLSDMTLDFDARYLANDITPEQMDKIGAQMEDSMGGMMQLLVGVSVAIFIVLMYLLTKTIIERSARAISYMKVFGYTNKEINQLYLRSITEVVIVSLIAVIPLIIEALTLLLKVVFIRYNGNFTMTLPIERVTLEVVLGIACYALVAYFHARRIKNVPLALALKTQE